MKEPAKYLKVRLPIAPLRNFETMVNHVGFSYTPKEKKDYMKKVSSIMSTFKGHFKGVRLIKAKFTFYIARTKVCPDYIPSGLWQTMNCFYKGTRPDTDNYVKPLQDSIGRGVIEKMYNKERELVKVFKGAGVIDDDAAIVDLRAIKVYTKRGEEPFIRIHLVEITNPIYQHEPTI